ncbi:hypothetical protein JX266_009523 [Neoarthrinium moseri]|uniref:uncharacterized protein n=1 Tax=Neoarthrinium moseri TaxID=1658444 RepID=UPI001FDB2D43|nr:uncharacterized protein JN550_003512 [Neoarthrinium moseri]KAI1844232.1 hypothetical protein JX266_009523 [Neoarthrinium moseri]KAI1873259.1 hypothetical protein JN550_003512 [Neoarthrinium moseri]
MDNHVRYPLNVAIIGIGHRGYNTHFLTLLENPRLWCVKAVCDVNPATRTVFASNHPKIPILNSISALLDQHGHQLDLAIVCVPHQFHLECCQALAKAGINILKEKPVAESREEYDQLLKLPVKAGITFQKRFEPRYLVIKDLLKQVGQVASFRAVLTASIDALDSGWRAKSDVGVTEDLGCHMLDMIVSLFGKPTSVTAQNALGVRIEQTYGGDDIANVIMNFGESAKRNIGHVHLSRVAHRSEESLVVTGTNGTFVLEGKEVVLRDNSGSETFRFNDSSSKRFAVKSMLQQFSAWITGAEPQFAASLANVSDTVSVMEAIQRSYGNPHATESLASRHRQIGKPFLEASLGGEHHVWPLLTAESEDAVVRQMHSSLSIYNRSDIYEVFEDRWRKMHNLKHALVCSSGTIAILHMFEALDLRPGDQVLCPVYTFFATASPLLQYGAVPVFCDSLGDGNMDPEEILKRSTPKTKAVIVTHMWGLPCRMRRIVDNAEKMGIKVLEDCSHAHGAVVDGKIVGSWGDMAAWSLQAKKNVMGGQAGVMATNSTDYYSRAILHGHFNKRAKQEVSESHPLRKFWLTGIGLNLRAHPLAIALANQQLDRLPSHDRRRQAYASYVARELDKIPFLKMPTLQNNRRDKHAWYAFVIQFDPSRAPKGLTRDEFVRRLEKRGVNEVDIPRSTGLLNGLPLFTHAHEAVPRFGPTAWCKPQATVEFPNAESFYNHAIKLPMWTTDGDKTIVEHYVREFLAVADEVMGNTHGQWGEQNRRQGTENPQARL